MPLRATHTVRRRSDDELLIDEVTVYLLILRTAASPHYASGFGVLSRHLSACGLQTHFVPHSHC